MPESELRLGIAVFTSFDTREISPLAPHWALVAHPTGFSNGGVQVFQSAKRLENNEWVLQHVASCSLVRSSLTLIGVIELGPVQMSSTNLHIFMNHFPATMSSDNPSGRPGWSSASWVIRALHHLVLWGKLTLPVPTDKIYDRAALRIRTLKEVQTSWRNASEHRDLRDKLQWIPF